MGRPRKPTALLEIGGAFKKNPQRKRPNEPKSGSPLGPPPIGFDQELKKIWLEITEMVPPNVLSIADRWLVEIACRAMRNIRHDKALASEKNLLVSCLSRMGLTPADRSKIAIPEKETRPDDEIAELAAASRAALRLN